MNVGEIYREAPITLSVEALRTLAALSQESIDRNEVYCFELTANRCPRIWIFWRTSRCGIEPSRPSFQDNKSNQLHRLTTLINVLFGVVLRITECSIGLLELLIAHRAHFDCFGCSLITTP